MYSKSHFTSLLESPLITIISPLDGTYFYRSSTIYVPIINAFLISDIFSVIKAIFSDLLLSTENVLDIHSENVYQIGHRLNILFQTILIYFISYTFLQGR